MIEEKQKIRRQIFALRKEMQEDKLAQWSEAIADKVIHLEEFEKSAYIYAYVDYNREVCTRPIIEAAWKAGKHVAVPKVHGKDLVFYEFTSYDQLEPGYFQIPEPVRGDVADWEEALLIMPGVAFDSDRRRVGYGGGFYDRYLEAHPGHFTAALAFAFQMIEAAPYEKTDIIPNQVITPDKIYR